MKFDYLKQPNLLDPHRPFIARPIIPVVLWNGQRKTEMLALVDSGADNSLFNFGLADDIGIDWKRGIRREFFGIDGLPVEVYMNRVEFQIKGSASRAQVIVGFTNAQGVSAVLGQEDFFMLNKIKFERNKESIEIIPAK